MRLREFKETFSGNRGDIASLHLINWNIVCRIKIHEGLGMWRIANRNKVLLGKWLWRLCIDDDKLLLESDF